MSKGQFFTFEGSEAVGKSSIMSQVSEYLTDRKIPFIQTREPGGTPLAEQMRHIIFHHDDRPSATTELLLMFAARCDHQERVIIPALKQGKIVLCDRYIDSSYVYQSVMHKIPTHLIDHLVQNYVTILPDLCFIIDCPADIAYQRIQKRGAQNINDTLPLQHFETIRQAFISRASNNQQYPYHIIKNIHLHDAVHQITNIIDR